MEIQSQDLQQIQLASHALNQLVESLDKRLSIVESAQSTSNDRYTILSGEIIKIGLQLQQLVEASGERRESIRQLTQLINDFSQLKQDFSQQQIASADRAKEARQSMQTIQNGLILFALVGTITFLVNVLFPHANQTNIRQINTTQSK